jgi:hypothetical protein
MANPTDRRLLRAVGDAAKALRSAARWPTSQRPVNAADDFVYEIYVYIKLLLLLQGKCIVTYVPGSGRVIHAFPRKPANKRGRPRFTVKSRHGDWQLCAGTKIRDLHGDSRAPDISLQRGTASEDPDLHDVAAIWDAKYKRKGARISSHEFSEFSRWLEVLNLRSNAAPSVITSAARDLGGHCLVTNGEHSTEVDAELARTNVREVASYYPGRTAVSRP